MTNQKLSWMCQYDDCERPREGSTSFCSSHNALDRKEQRDSLKPVKVPKPLKRTPVKKMSAKRKTEHATYIEKAAAHLKAHPNCQIKLAEVCTKKATEIHHSAKRGKNYLNEKTFLSACRECHSVVETKLSASERREKGLLK